MGVFRRSSGGRQGGEGVAGDWGVGSDVDLVVIVADSTEPFERRAAAWDATELPPPARAPARDGVPLYEATAGELAEFVSLAIRRFADTRKFREAERAVIRDVVARGSRAR